MKQGDYPRPEHRIDPPFYTPELNQAATDAAQFDEGMAIGLLTGFVIGTALVLVAWAAREVSR